MRPVIRLVFLLLIFSFQSYGQDSTSQIKDKWKLVKSLLQERSKIIIKLTKTLSKSKVDEKQNNTLKNLATDLYNYVDSLSLKDSVSISIAATKNETLWQSLVVTLIEIESNQDIKIKQKFATIQGELEGCENSIKKGTRDYNDICRKYKRTDLLFLSDNQQKPAEVQF